MEGKLWGLGASLRAAGGKEAQASQPIWKALDLLAEADSSPPEEAEKQRAEALDLLEKLHAQLAVAPDGSVLHEAQHLVKSCIDLMREGDGSLTYRKQDADAEAKSDAAALIQALENRAKQKASAAVKSASIQNQDSYSRSIVAEMLSSIADGASPPPVRTDAAAAAPVAAALATAAPAAPAAAAPAAAAPAAAAPAAAAPAPAAAAAAAAAATTTASAARAAPAAADVKDPAQPSPTVGISAKSPFGFVPMLERMSSDWKGDKFWKDLAQPVDFALDKLAEAEGSDGAAAITSREQARAALAELNETLVKASANNLFVEEQRVLSKALEAMSLSGGALPSPKTAEEEGEAAALMQSLEAARQARNDAKSKAEGARPYSFTQVANRAELTVLVPVPPSTRAKHVDAKIKRKSLAVAVAQHQLQPHVLAGDLPHTIDVEASGWHLEGEGDARVLVIDLHKEQAGLEWPGLLMAS